MLTDLFARGPVAGLISWRFDYEPFDITLCLLVALAVFALRDRIKNGLQGDLALVFWLVMIGVNYLWPTFEWPWLYGGIAMTLLLRFEFLTNALTWPFRAGEVVALFFVAWQALAVAFNVRY